MEADGGRQADADDPEAKLIDRVQAPAADEQRQNVQGLLVQEPLEFGPGRSRGVSEVVRELADQLAKDDVHERQGNPRCDGGYRCRSIYIEIIFGRVAEDPQVIGKLRDSLWPLGMWRCWKVRSASLAISHVDGRIWIVECS